MKTCPDCKASNSDFFTTCQECGAELAAAQAVGYTEKCPHCYGEIDYRAKVCPHCRKKVHVSSKYKIGNYVLFLLIVTVPIAYFLGGFTLAVMVLLAQVIVGGALRKF